MGNKVQKTGPGIEIFLFFLISFFVRLFLLDTNKLPFPDSMNYIMLGYNFVRGNFSEGTSFSFPMLVPVFIGLVSLIIKDHVLAGYITSISFGSLLVIPAYLFAYNTANRKIARLAALLLAFYPFLIEWSIEPTTDIAYTFFFMCSIYSGWQAITTHRLTKFITTGIFLGLAYLTRAVGFFVFICMLSLLLLLHLKQRKIFLKNIIALILGFCFLAAPYIIFERIYTRQWTISMMGKYNLIYNDMRNYMGGKTIMEKWEAGLYPDKSSTLVDDFIYNTGKPSKKPVLPCIEKIPFKKRVIRFLKYIFQFYNDFIYKIFPPVILILSAMGFASITSASKIPRGYLYLLLFIVLSIFQYFYSHIEERYFLTTIPIVIIFSGIGLDLLLRVIRNKAFKFIIIFMIFGLLILDMPLVRAKIKYLKGASPQIPGQKAAGLWLREKYPEHTLCLMGDARTALYARTNKLIVIPAYCTTEEIIEYARLKKADFIIISERDIIIHDRYRQEPLLNPQNAPADLEMVYQYDKDTAWGKILVYKLKTRP